MTTVESFFIQNSASSSMECEYREVKQPGILLPSDYYNRREYRRLMQCKMFFIVLYLGGLLAIHFTTTRIK